MNYELTNIIRPNDVVWKKQKNRLVENQGKVITLAPIPNFNKMIKMEHIDGINIIDFTTKRTHDPLSSLFFNQVPTVRKAEIFMNEDWTISLINDGEEIGRMELYPETRRLVKAVEYLNQDGTTDFIEEYADDGQLFSNIFYANGRAEQIDFYNSKKLPIVSYYFYEGQNNFVVLRNPNTLEVIKKYANSIEFIAEQVANLVSEQDTITICYMGIELMVLKDTTSHNILYLEESPLDNENRIKQNLFEILEGRITYVHEIRMSNYFYQQLKEYKVSLSKVKIINE